jgi:4'-phosphopantetheinyl transferase
MIYTNEVLWQTNFVGLRKGELHLWLVNLNHHHSIVDESAKILSLNEMTRAEKFHFEKDRTYYIIRRCILKEIISKYLKIPSKDVKYTYHKYGKPSLKSDLDMKLYFNLSHSNGMALYAFSSDNTVGTDLEYINNPMFMKKDLSQYAETFLTPQELTNFLKIPEEKRKTIFFKLWTIKEAFSKAVGTGVHEFLKDIEIIGNRDIALGLKSIKYPGEIIRAKGFSFLFHKDYSAACFINCQFHKSKYSIRFCKW